MNTGAATGYRVLRDACMAENEKKNGRHQNEEEREQGRFACFAWLPLELSTVVLVGVEVGRHDHTVAELASSQALLRLLAIDD